MKAIFYHTIQTAIRQKHIQLLSIVLLLLFVLVAINSSVAYQARLQSFEQAKNFVRQAWLNQGPQNPHSSAHYGHYIFQPVTPMQFLDNGIRPFAGSILRLEAHAQNEAAFSPAQDKSELSRFGDMGFAWMLQVLMPLFIILLCFNAVNADRESQNLKLLAAQGVSNKSYLWGKITALYSIVLAITATGLFIQLGTYFLISKDGESLPASGLMAWLGLYAAYLFIITSLSVLVSAWVKEAKSSLIVQLAAWVLLMMIMPKVTASVGASLYPLEHKAVFTKALREDREKGIDGHNPEDKRSKAFEDSLLKHYKADSMNQLPVNSDGLLMQADEEYANIVYDKHFKRIRETITKQNSISAWCAFINPYFFIRNGSMKLSESSFENHLELLTNAEQYRRYLIKELNDKMAYGGSKTGDWLWKVDAGYWATIKDFSYPKASLAAKLRSSSIESGAMILWILLTLLSITISAKKLKVI